MTIVLLIIVLVLLGWAAAYLLLIPLSPIMLVLHALQKVNEGKKELALLYCALGLASFGAVLYIIFG
ncbi:MAG: hypothetical protein EAY75_06330 [Bacteroidetes bacterium]|nr:MAG: hypothetical protein EAY75_06330 [Bacteroidota bacterium]